MSRVERVPGLNIRPFTDALRKNGIWTKDFDSRAGGQRVVQLKRVLRLRTLVLQLWADGKHRVTFEQNGRMTTPPTEFTDIPGMRAAIVVETSRAPRIPT